MTFRNRLLLVAASFPPVGSSNSTRATFIVKHLAASGWEIKVLTVSEKRALTRRVRDDSLLPKLPPGVEVRRTIGGILGKAYRQFSGPAYGGLNESGRAILSRFLIPDPWVDWVPGAVLEGTRMLRNWRPDVIVSMAYPFTCHLIGFMLHRKLEIPLHLDYGDPWSSSPDTRLAKPFLRIATGLERKILLAASSVSMTTDETVSLYLRDWPFLKGRIFTVPMGFDPVEFLSAQPKTFAKFTILHAGVVLHPYRDPAPLFQALSAMIKEDPKISGLVQVVFLGEMEKTYVESLDKLGLLKLVTVIRRVPFDESLSWIKGADVLLLLGNVGSVQVPAKVYHYVCSGKPVLLIKRENEDPAERLLMSARMLLVTRNNPLEIKEALARLIHSRDGGSMNSDAPSSADYMSDYSWENVVRRLDSRLRDSAAL